MFLKNKNIIFKIRRSKVTDCAALNKRLPIPSLPGAWQKDEIVEVNVTS